MNLNTKDSQQSAMSNEQSAVNSEQCLPAGALLQGEGGSN